MIPLRDHNPASSTPVVTYGLIGLNVLLFVFMLTLPERGVERFINTYALQPFEIIRGVEFKTLFTSMFLHGGFGHIVGNMMFLHIFGDNLEDFLGKIKYFLFYLLCGLGAAFLQILIDPQSTVPMLGASGAIAGLMGGYLVLFPKHKIDILIPFGGFLEQATVPAYTMLFYWIVAQFFSGFGQLIVSSAGGVAYWAHIGGFLMGVIFVFLYRRIKRS